MLVKLVYSVLLRNWLGAAGLLVLRVLACWFYERLCGELTTLVETLVQIEIHCSTCLASNAKPLNGQPRGLITYVDTY